MLHFGEKKIWVKNFSNSKKFYKCFDFSGGQNFAKVPQYWSSFLKKIHCIFCYIRGGGGARPNVTFVTFFFFEGLPNNLIMIFLSC